MVEHNGWEETIFSVLILGETFSLIGLSNTIMVVSFLSGINLSIFLPLKPKIYRIGNATKILFPRSNKQNDSHPPTTTHTHTHTHTHTFYPLLQDFQN